MASYANEQSGGFQQGAQQAAQSFDAHQQVTENHAGGASNGYYQQPKAQEQFSTQQYGQQYNESGLGQNTMASQNNETSDYNQHFNQGQQQQTYMQQQSGQLTNGGQTNGKPGGQQLGAGEPAAAAEQDTLHKLLDRIEKKFGGDRFNNPDNYAKNQKLNDSLILKLKQVGKIVMQRGPRMVMNMVR